MEFKKEPLVFLVTIKVYGPKRSRNKKDLTVHKEFYRLKSNLVFLNLGSRKRADFLFFIVCIPNIYDLQNPHSYVIYIH